MPDFSHETAFAQTVGCLPTQVAGIDEVGRGPWAGPVTACALLLDPAELPAEIVAAITDSKKLSARKRQQLAPILRAACSWGLGEASVAEIDQLNILQASMLAMQRALAALCSHSTTPPPQAALVDGNRLPELPVPARALVGGDHLALSIAAASILAKVHRDQQMADYDQLYPGYGFTRHAGYGTAQHQQALQQLGPCPIHRQSFAPIKALMGGTSPHS